MNTFSDKLINSKLLSTGYTDLLDSDNILANYFASWYETVQMFEITGPNGRSLTVEFTGILFLLAVPLNFPGAYPLE